MAERPEKEPSLIAAENDAEDPPVEDETELSSSWQLKMSTPMLSVPHTSYAKDTVLLNFNENKINSQTVYPVISMKVKGQSLTILVDSGASSSHITRKAANKVGVIEKDSNTSSLDLCVW